jgi:CheY-like chemotaxis protein
MFLLIVDNSPVNLRLLRAQLEEEGHEIAEAANGVEALLVLEHMHMDAVISDILMPAMDGYRLCYEIRQSATRNAGVAIVLYTATYSSESDRQLAETMGADQYLFKPASTCAILAAVDEAQKKSSGRQKSRRPAERSHGIDRSGVELVHKLEVRNREMHQMQTTHLTTLSRMQELNQMLERDVAQLRAALTQFNGKVKPDDTPEDEALVLGALVL